MIRWIKGSVVSCTDGSVVLFLGSIALEIKVPGSYQSSLPIGSDVEFHTHLEVSERDWSVYGFLTQEELGMFEKLLGVNGVGPKSALSIMSHASPRDLVRAVKTQSAELLKRKGLGLKTAEKIIAGLKGKVDDMEGVDGGDAAHHRDHDQDVFAALSRLGYKDADIRSILPRLDPHADVDEKIKQALGLLA